MELLFQDLDYNIKIDFCNFRGVKIINCKTNILNIIQVNNKIECKFNIYNLKIRF